MCGAAGCPEPLNSPTKPVLLLVSTIFSTFKKDKLKIRFEDKVLDLVIIYPISISLSSQSSLSSQETENWFEDKVLDSVIIYPISISLSSQSSLSSWTYLCS